MLTPIFRDERRRRLVIPQRVGQVLAEVPAAVVVDHSDLVEPKPVHVVLVEEHAGVADQELADVGLSVVEDLPTRLAPS
jgi:hypothetical protein